MDGSQHPSGLGTPPLVSPRPIQPNKPSTVSNHTSWKVVGSPPRGTISSPPNNHVNTSAQKSADKGVEKSIENSENSAEKKVENSTESSSGIEAKVHNDIAFNEHKQHGYDNLSSVIPETTASHEHPIEPLAVSAPVSDTSSTPVVSYGLSVNDSCSSPFRQKQLDGSLQTPTTPSPQALQAFTHTLSSLDSLIIDPSSKFYTPNTSPSHDSSFSRFEINANTKGQHERQRYSNNTLHISSEPNNSVAPKSGVTVELESPLSMTSFLWNDCVTKDGAYSTSTFSTTRSENPNVTREDTLTALQTDPFVPNVQPRTFRSLSLSEPPGFNLGLANAQNGAKRSGYSQENVDPLGSSYRIGLPTMEEEFEDSSEHLRTTRARSFSTSAAFGPRSFQSLSTNTVFYNVGNQDLLSPSASGTDPGPLSQLNNQDQHPFLQRKHSGYSTWPSLPFHNTNNSRSTVPSNHRRSITSNSYVPPIWETPRESPHLLPPLPVTEQERLMERQRIPRRFSLAPSSGFQPYDQFLESEHLGAPSLHGPHGNRSLLDNESAHLQRRHSVAGPSGPYVYSITTSTLSLCQPLESLQLDAPEAAQSWNLREEFEHDYKQNQTPGTTDAMGSNDLGKGVTLSQLSHYGALYLVEFKAGRSDLFYVADGSNMTFKCGDLVMVEADRGKDLGKITNDSITPSQIQALQKEQTEAAAMGAQQEGQRTSKELHPKRIFRPALPSEIAQLANKNQDEIKAMLVCQNRVRQKKLPMEVVDAEYQWDRRKLTFYFRAEHRIDFRELVRDLFKIYKTRIWMYAVSPSKATLNNRDVGMQMSTPHTQTSPLVSSSPPQSLQSIQRQNHSISLTSTHPHGHNPHQQQYPHHHPAQYHQLQAQDQMLQMQSHYFSAPPQQMFYHGFQNDRPLLDDGSSHLPLYDPTYPLQSPHPLM